VDSLSVKMVHRAKRGGYVRGHGWGTDLCCVPRWWTRMRNGPVLCTTLVDTDEERTCVVYHVRGHGWGTDLCCVPRSWTRMRNGPVLCTTLVDTDEERTCVVYHVRGHGWGTDLCCVPFVEQNFTEGGRGWGSCVIAAWVLLEWNRSRKSYFICFMLLFTSWWHICSVAPTMQN